MSEEECLDKYLDEQAEKYVERMQTRGYGKTYKIILDLQQKVEQLEKENDDLRRIYQNTYKKYLENGNEEMARYFMAQIDACPTFYVEPVIDYYKEYHRLENIIKEATEYCNTHYLNPNEPDLLNILNKGSK